MISLKYMYINGGQAEQISDRAGLKRQQPSKPPGLGPVGTVSSGFGCEIVRYFEIYLCLNFVRDI